MSKLMPNDFPYTYIPMGINWVKSRRIWLVRRGDKHVTAAKEFRSYEDALEFWNELYKDKKAPLKPGERPYNIRSDQKPVSKKPSLDEYVSLQLEELNARIDEMTNQMDRFLNHIIKNEDLFDFVNGTGKFYKKPQEEFPVLEEVKD